MKIKEVCAKTGLTERAVRLYCSERLLLPIQSEQRGRVYLDFRDEDVAILQQIATLRGVGFSLDEIRLVFDEPAQIGGLIEALRNRLGASRQHATQTLAALERIDITAPPSDAASLCEAISAPMTREYANATRSPSARARPRQPTCRFTPTSTAASTVGGS